MVQAAQRILGSSCGPNMNTWFVASHPIGHHAELGRQSSDVDPKMQQNDTTAESSKIFFMKARIFAGQADLKDNMYNIEDFKWLSKDEIKKHVTPEYWSNVKNMLVEQ